VVEHDLAKVGVEGSNPFARSNFPSLPSLGFAGAFCIFGAIADRVDRMR
jgi:hypothetical protein